MKHKYAVGLVDPAIKDDVCNIAFMCPTRDAAKNLVRDLSRWDDEETRKWPNKWEGPRLRWAFRKIADGENIFKSLSHPIEVWEEKRA